MGKIEGIRIENYGSLKSVKLGKLFSYQAGEALGNMTTIIGPSGTGKSTVADAFGFLADCLDKGVEEACDMNYRGGFDRLASQNSSAPIKFELYYRETSNSRPITYELEIDLDNKDRPYVKLERLRMRQKTQAKGYPLTFLYLAGGKGYAYEGKESGETDAGVLEGAGRRVEVNLADKRKLGISTYGTMQEYTRIVDFLDFLKSWYLCYFSPDKARQEQFFAPHPHLNRTGSNINNVAHYMYREDRAGFDRVLADIQKKLKGIKEITPSPMDDKRIVLRFLEEGFSEPFYSPRMSDGTLKLFAYYLLLNEHTPRQLVFIEEPENGLYHQYLADLAIELRKGVGTGFKKQVFVTTHSPFFVNALEPKDVWVLEKGEDGFSQVKRASDYDYVKSMVDEGVSLGDLWFSQYFG
ncbi:MAG: AAA family ATPase [Oscillospiraceae bacterium]|jgi:predicted ATPase|nr:AAA family ATPase [Oscillospiraceae bacterium]